MSRRLAAIVFCLLASLAMPGCLIVDTRVTNPIPGLSTVAVAPFFNLSSERAVDSRRFAAAYVSELQKVPGFQVVPLGVTETAIIEHGLQMDNPDDVLHLAELLGVDAVVVGAVTDYTPYYPPRIGLHVSWFSPEPWAFYPGVQVEPEARRTLKQQQEQYRDLEDVQRKREVQAARRAKRALRNAKSDHGSSVGDCPPQNAGVPTSTSATENSPVVRGQSPVLPASAVRMQTGSIVDPAGLPHVDFPECHAATPFPADRMVPGSPWVPMAAPVRSSYPTVPTRVVPFTAPLETAGPLSAPVIRVTSVPPPPAPVEAARQPSEMAPPPEEGEVEELAPAPMPDAASAELALPPPAVLAPAPLPPMAAFGPPPLPPFDPREPLMSYTRIFDAADAALTANLRDYVELSGDLRSGGWEAHLHRSDDFIKFTAYRMIVEMLTLHGGEGQRRFVFKMRKFR